MEKRGVRKVKEDLGIDFWTAFLKGLARDGESSGRAWNLRRRAGVVLGVGGNRKTGLVEVDRSFSRGVCGRKGNSLNGGSSGKSQSES